MRALVRQRPFWRPAHIAHSVGRSLRAHSSNPGRPALACRGLSAPAWFDPQPREEPTEGGGIIGGLADVCPRKRRVAIYFGSVGGGNSDAQQRAAARTEQSRFNPEGLAPSEHELVMAIWRAGGIRDTSALWSLGRSNAVDASGHALVNVISLDVLFRGEDPWLTDPFGTQLADQINAFLGPNVRVYALRRATKTWNARSACNVRMYHSIVPAWILRKHGDEDDAVIGARAAHMNSALLRMQGSHSFHNFDGRLRDGRKDYKLYMDDDDDDDVDDDDAYVHDERASDSSAPPQLLLRLQRGRVTRNPGLSSRRFRAVSVARCEGPLQAMTSAGEPVLRAHVSSMAFMQRQLQLMVGTATWMARNEIPLAMASALLSPRVLARLPCAPATTTVLSGGTFRAPRSLHEHRSGAAALQEHDAKTEGRMTDFFHERIAPTLEPLLARDGSSAWCQFETELREEFETAAAREQVARVLSSFRPRDDSVGVHLTTPPQEADERSRAAAS